VNQVDSRHPPGAVGLIMGDQPRFQHLQASLIALEVPRGSQMFVAQSCNPAMNSNRIAQMMLDNPELQWLWVMGDDHCFEKDALLRLLDDEKDAIVPLVARRMWPHGTVLWREFDPDENVSSFYTWEEVSRFKEPFPVAGAGSAGLLVRRRVFERMQKPWFRVGAFGRDELQEDLYFTWQCNRMGHTVHCDPNVTMGHLSYVNFYPYRNADGQIGVAANMNGHKMTVLPPGQRLKAVA
jgi:hypothetical protein